MFRNKETVFYLFLVMVICELSYSGLVCCGFFWFFVLFTILENKDVFFLFLGLFDFLKLQFMRINLYILGYCRLKVGRNAAPEYDMQWSAEQFLPLST